jgi:CRISPR-associated protein Cmr4
MLTHLFHLHALSALHVGVGQAIGVVDLPIARAKATHLPLVPGSALKGVLRDQFPEPPSEVTARLFGPDRIGTHDDGHAGALAFGDAHLLLLPVRSLAGVMAWATCPFVLSRYAVDLTRAGQKTLVVPEVAAGQALVPAESVLKASQDTLILDDLDLAAATASDAAQAWARRIGEALHPGDANWQAQLHQHFAILSDDDFSFLADTATEVRARIRINATTGVVDRGAFWYEENLPAETVLWGLIGVGPSRVRGAPRSASEIQRDFREGLPHESLLQIGGKATIGRGLVRFVLAQEQAA